MYEMLVPITAVASLVIKETDGLLRESKYQLFLRSQSVVWNRTTLRGKKSGQKAVVQELNTLFLCASLARYQGHSHISSPCYILSVL